MGVVDVRVYIYTATALGRGRVASPMLSCLYPPLVKGPQYSIYRRLSGPQDQPGHKGVKNVIVVTFYHSYFSGFPIGYRMVYSILVALYLTVVALHL